MFHNGSLLPSNTMTMTLIETLWTSSTATLLVRLLSLAVASWCQHCPSPGLSVFACRICKSFEYFEDLWGKKREFMHDICHPTLIKPLLPVVQDFASFARKKPALFCWLLSFVHLIAQRPASISRSSLTTRCHRKRVSIEQPEHKRSWDQQYKAPAITDKPNPHPKEVRAWTYLQYILIHSYPIFPGRHLRLSDLDSKKQMAGPRGA